MNPLTFLDQCKVNVWSDTYSVIKTKTIPTDFVAIIKDQQEITAIVSSSQVVKSSAVETEGNWKILTFDAVLPFELVGFLAAVAQVLAKAQISIFALSAYSTDHILIKENMLEKALQELKKLGCITG